MSDHTSEQTSEPDEQTTGPTTASSTGGPTDEDLPGNRTDGPDEDPLDAAEAEGGEVGAG